MIMDSWVMLPTLRSFGASIPGEMEQKAKLWEAGPLPVPLPALLAGSRARHGESHGTCRDGAHDRLGADGAMHGHQRYQVLSGWLQACQAGVPAGAVKRELLCLFLIPGAVGKDEAVCWWGWITPCDVHTGGCQLGEVELCDGPDPCKMERGDATPTVCRSWPLCCSQCLYGKYPTEVAKLQLWALH